MDGLRSPSYTRFAAVAAVLATLLPASLQAETHREGFDDAEPSWTLHAEGVRVHAHRRNRQIMAGGEASEQVQLEAAAPGQIVRLEHPLPPATVLPDESKVSLSFRSNRPGAVLLMRVVFPHQTDPRTGELLTAYCHSRPYAQPGKWETLVCLAETKQLQDQVRRLRAQLNDYRLDVREPYVDRVLLSARLDTGVVEFFLDELEFGPIVSPREDAPIIQAAAETEAEPPTVEHWQDRLLVEGRPFFPRIAADHDETAQQLRDAGLNVIWVPDYQDESRLAALRDANLWAMARPPRAVDAQGRTLSAGEAGLTPFGPETKPVLLWYQGTRIPTDAENAVAAWADQIRSADRELRRPIMADVAGLEWVYSRHVPLLGVSRHPLGTTWSLKQFRDDLIRRRKRAHPGTFFWTWIQTEPAAAVALDREEAGLSPMVVEPEQIRLQTYAALAAGCHGIGFWKTTPLDTGLPGGRERLLAITQLNLELELLEPWLATGTVLSHVPFTVTRPQAGPISRSRLDFRNAPAEQAERDALLRERDYRLRRDQQVWGELEATILRTDQGILLLPVWYQADAQYVPGQLAANDATIVVQGVPESASAWEITTTGIRSLERERVPGGLKITLKKFDQTAAVVLLSRDQLQQKERLRRRIEQLAPTSAAVSVELAAAKLERVRQVDAELQTLDAAQPDGHQLLARAAQLVEEARSHLHGRNFDAARESAADAMQLLRILQRAHWFSAVQTLSAPVTSPHAVCFQTLPDHWRMVRALGRSPIRNDANLLETGSFEEIEAMIAAGWQHEQNAVEGVQATAGLDPAAYS
ncbi:MAG: hypothetical protein ACREIV_01455, partial [Planctomycetaceae bacterium]